MDYEIGIVPREKSLKTDDLIKIGNWLHQSSERHGYSFMSGKRVLDAWQCGMVDLWTVRLDGSLKGAFATRILQTDHGNILNFYGTGGDQFLRWREAAFDKVEAFAKNNQCVAIEFIGHPAFMRLQPDYQCTAHMYVKRL